MNSSSFSSISLFTEHMLDKVSVDLSIIDLCNIITLFKVSGRNPQLTAYLDNKVSSYLDTCHGSVSVH